MSMVCVMLAAMFRRQIHIFKTRPAVVSVKMKMVKHAAAVHGAVRCHWLLMALLDDVEAEFARSFRSGLMNADALMYARIGAAWSLLLVTDGQTLLLPRASSPRREPSP